MGAVEDTAAVQQGRLTGIMPGILLAIAWRSMTAPASCSMNG